MTPQELRTPGVVYPESDGKPMAETDRHRNAMVELIAAVDERFSDVPDIYVSGNLFIYFEEGNNQMVVAPDFFVVRGVPKGERRTYLLWKEKKAPDLVIELTSRSTRFEDLGTKRAIYEELGVREYFVFDPEGSGSSQQFLGFRLRGGSLEPLSPIRTATGAQVFRSEVLGLELHGSGGTLRWVDPRTGAPLPIRKELRERLLAESRRAEQEARRAEREARRADDEKQRADAAEAQNAALRAEIERLRKPPGAG
jgi:Uma2 family endonuclease